MKTHKQIIQWLKNKKVFEEFCTEFATKLLHYNLTLEEYFDQLGMLTINYFAISVTKKGEDYWTKIDKEFRVWYT